MKRKIIFGTEEITSAPLVVGKGIRRFVVYYEHKRLLLATNCRNLNTIKSILREILAVDFIDCCAVNESVFTISFAYDERHLMIDTERKDGCAIVNFVRIVR